MKRWKQLFGATSGLQRTKFLAENPCIKHRPLLRDTNNGGQGNDVLERFRLTDSGVDREGDVIISSGVDTAQWEANGSLLWGHDPRKPEYVLGAPVEVIRGDSWIDATFRFASEEENPTGAMVYRMIQAGLVRGSSVGLIILEYTEANERGGYMPLNIVRSELLEHSITPIPANPRAVLQEFPDSADQKQIVEIIERTVEEVGVTDVEEDLALLTLRELTGQKTSNLAAGPDPVLAAYRAFTKGE